MSKPIEQPVSCPSCGNPNLARYINSATCACGWSSAVTIEFRSQPEGSRPIGLTREWLLKLWIHFWVRVSLKAKCPACGHRAKHQIKWSEAVKRIVHLCAVCKAVWPEQPIMDPANWSITITANEEPRQAAARETEARS